MRFSKLSFLALGVLASAPAWAGKCLGDSAQYQVMPKLIGRENEIFKTPYALPCESMVVPAGQTTIIHASSMVHFGPNPSSASKICVKGNLRVLGNPDHAVYFSGTVKQSQVGYIPGSQVWDGIEVDSGASVEFQHVRIFNAPTAMTIFSRNIMLAHSYFQGSSGIIMPDTSIFLNTQGTTIDTLDLRNSSPSSTNPLAGKKSEDGQKSGVNKASGKKIGWYSLAGASVMAASGLTWLAMQPASGSKPPPVTNGDQLDPNPTLPTTPKPR